ncbi:MAG TPA: TatD family hydrolase [Thermomicrobiaceae bacterium]|nr:TatD family hydrolase [Thermomicrobiaceae bacterium]
MRLVDTHCHLDLETFDADRDEVFTRARDVGVDHFLVIGFAPERWQTTLALTQAQPGVFAAVGLHPSEAERYSPNLLVSLDAAAHADRVRAIGETGMDYHWDGASPAVQRAVFEAQIALAKSLGLPFVVHQRDAEADTVDVLRATNPPHAGVMHCFTGDLDFADECLALGLHLGLGGAVTFRKATALHEVVRRAPVDRLVLETDAPFMAPSPHRGRRNEPAYVELVARRVAELREIDVEAVATVTTRNARVLFHLDSTEGTG